MFGALDISTSALVANRTRLEIVSANLANREATHDAAGKYNPYRRRIAVLATGDPTTGSDQGVHVQDIQLDSSPFQPRYEPGNPDADANGYVRYPNVEPTFEMVNAMEISRAYEANITAAEATKAMLQSSLRLLA